MILLNADHGELVTFWAAVGIVFVVIICIIIFSLIKVFKKVNQDMKESIADYDKEKD